MDKTVLIAALTLVITPILTSLIQNVILRIGKKDDITLAREELMIKREAALEAKRTQWLADLEKDLAEAVAEREKWKTDYEKIKNECEGIKAERDMQRELQNASIPLKPSDALKPSDTLSQKIEAVL